MSIIYTSAGASVNDATTTVSGKVRLATIAEAGGTSEAIAVTPAGLQAEISGMISGTQYQGAVAYDAIATTLASASVGDMYRLSSTGSAHGYDFTIGDLIIVNADMGGTFDANKIDRFDTTDADLATVATTGSYNDLLNQPSIPSASTDLTDTASLVRTTDLATVATSGSYNDLLNQPSIPSASTDLTDTASLVRTTDLATVATSGSYNDLLNQPSIPSASTDLTDTASLVRTTDLATVATSGSYNDLLNQPSIPASSDDLTSDHTGVNYTGALNASITTHLSGIDSALASVGASGYPVQTAIGGLDETGTGGSDNSTSVSLNTALVLTALGSNDVEVKLPLISTASDGDVVIILRSRAGDLKITKNDSETVSTPITYLDQSPANSVTITNNQQQIHVRFDSASQGRWFIFDKAQAVVATSGSYNDLLNQPSIPSASTDLTDTASLIRTSNTASTTSAGIVEIADNTETSAGTSTTLAVSPASLANELNNLASTDLSDTASLVRTTDLATVATSGSYNDLLNQPSIPASSDDLTSDHTGVNYTGALNASITTHLSGIDSALASVGGGGGGGYTYSAITATTTAQLEYHYSCGAGNQTFTVNLPAVTSGDAGKEIRIKNMGTGTITVDGNSTSTIDGQQTIDLDVQYSSITLVATGDSSASWEIV